MRKTRKIRFTKKFKNLLNVSEETIIKFSDKAGRLMNLFDEYHIGGGANFLIKDEQIKINRGRKYIKIFYNIKLKLGETVQFDEKILKVSTNMENPENPEELREIINPNDIYDVFDLPQIVEYVLERFFDKGNV